MRPLLPAALAILTLSACGGGENALKDFRSATAGPEELSVVTADPLRIPPDLTRLPPPAPGADNLAAPGPRAARQ